ncbi:unnamed protein product [Peniophora sp. CBMAI 1063]|nr:unnamed protein product [Peniophora sp. CBMAI 1063]
MLFSTRISALTCLALSLAAHGAPTSTETTSVSIRNPQSVTGVVPELLGALDGDLSQILGTLLFPSPISTSLPAKRQIFSALTPLIEDIFAEAAALDGALKA